MEAEAMKPSHVAVLSNPGLGHIIPFLEFAKRLVIHHGVHVSFLVINTINEASSAQDQLLNSPSLPVGLDIIKLPPVDVLAITSVDMLVFTRVCVIAEESLKSLKPVLLKIGKPNALVIDLFCTQAFQVCNELSIPVYTFCTSSIFLLAFSLYLPTLDREVEVEFIELPEPIKVPGCCPLWPQDLLDPVKNRKIDEYKWFLLHVSRLALAAGIFLNSWADLEPAALQAVRENPFFKELPTPPVHPIGPLIKQEEPLTDIDIECLGWLDKQPPESVLYVSLGSGGTLTAKQLAELAWGLELSEQRFILVARKPVDTCASATFFTVGSDNVNDPSTYLPEGFLARTSGRGLVVPSWASQVAVLKHPSTGGFLSHCGWNSTLESVSHGVPMIAWPLYAEQRMNAAVLAEEVKIGIRPALEAESMTVGREEVERVVRFVMESDEGKAMRERVRKLKECAATALGVGGSSYESLACLAQQWKAELQA